jgi:hypothetical protein
MEIDELQAGPDLDRLVAERVMNWKPPEPSGERIAYDGGPPLDERSPYRIKPYSTDIAAAWEVLERLYHLADFMRLERDKTEWSCTWWLGGSKIWHRDHRATANTAPLAICRAALKVVGDA